MKEITPSNAILSFEQKEGLVPLPSQLKLKEVSRTLSAKLWELIFTLVTKDSADSMRREWLGGILMPVYRDFLVERLGEFVTRDYYSKSEFIDAVRPIYVGCEYGKVIGTTEWFVQRIQLQGFSSAVSNILEKERAAYRLVDGSIIPIASEEEGQVISKAFAVTSASKFGGARKHLASAGGFLTAGSFNDSVRESIHSVESIARTLTGKGSLKEALADLHLKVPIHQALRTGFNSIYGYTSDAGGIRHASLGENGSNVTEEEALFMLGACASFVTFLVNSYGNR